jgi:hypothetical protein
VEKLKFESAGVNSNNVYVSAIAKFVQSEIDCKVIIYIDNPEDDAQEVAMYDNNYKTEGLKDRSLYVKVNVMENSPKGRIKVYMKTIANEIGITGEDTVEINLDDMGTRIPWITGGNIQNNTIVFDSSYQLNSKLLGSKKGFINLPVCSAK